ncbi:protein LURP-one-related 6 [Phalaenopsis equestris]|uniref:protein LURP-one-related 6 n=1 Tax=Phalaenopsis equestris TaxID=78828 RepID=UPI0009E61255|nr:protein LURP-one-related 6 [Phalaenopsis equestris]
MAAEASENLMPIVSKLFCSSSLTAFVVRRRPHAINGGGLVVTDCSLQKVAFRVDGCGVLGAKGELVVRDGDGSSVLYINKKQGIIEAMSSCSKWNGHVMEVDGVKEKIFRLIDSKPFFARCNATKIYIEPKRINNKEYCFEVIGSFPQRNCIITAPKGIIVAQVGLKEMNGSKDLYSVVVHPGFDQAFVIGVIAILDYLNGESTAC